jgi:hypothetical protein
MFRSLIILVCVGCAAPVHMSNCDEGFRDTWWYIDPDVTDEMNLAPTCFYVDSLGEMETVHYDSDITMSNQWTCVGDNDIRIKGRGRASFLPTEESDVWMVDLNLTVPPVNKVASVEPCHWLEW